jgi:hypothetical protein
MAPLKARGQPPIWATFTGWATLSSVGLALLLMAHVRLQWTSSTGNGSALVSRISPPVPLQSGPDVSRSEDSTNRTTRHDVNAVAIANAAKAVDKVSLKILRIAKPLLLEVGILLLCQAVGFQFLIKLLTPLMAVRRFRPFKVFLSPRHVRALHAGGTRIWKALLAAYSKTSASKLVNRSKKILKSLIHLHHGDEDDDDHDEYCDEHDNHGECRKATS